MHREIISTAQLAIMLGLKPQTLRLWRLQGRGPQYIRFGESKSRVFYRLVDIDEWISRNIFINTSDETQRRYAS